MALEPLREHVVRHAHDVERLIRRQLIRIDAGPLTNKLHIDSRFIHFPDALGKIRRIQGIDVRPLAGEVLDSIRDFRSRVMRMPIDICCHGGFLLYLVGKFGILRVLRRVKGGFRKVRGMVRRRGITSGVPGRPMI